MVFLKNEAHYGVPTTFKRVGDLLLIGTDMNYLLYIPLKAFNNSKDPPLYV